MVAFDQSYDGFGYSVASNGKVIKYGTLRLTVFKTKAQKRKAIRALVYGLSKRHKPNKIIVERTRVFSQGFISKKTIMSFGSLLTVIVDSSPGGTPIYSVDTRSWKSKVIGRAAASKQDAVSFARKLGLRPDSHDAADAICISLYAFVHKPLLQREAI